MFFCTKILRGEECRIPEHTQTGSHSVAELITKFRSGNRDAAGQLVEMFYPQLHHMAAARMNGEKPGHTWQPTALINELYMELVKIKELKASGAGANDERAAFFAFAGFLMNRLLAQHARRLYRKAEKTSVDEGDWQNDAGLAVDSLFHIEQLLSKLAAINPRIRSVVELRVFGGLSGDEIADHLGVTRRTISRDWTFAKEMLGAEFDTLG